MNQPQADKTLPLRNTQRLDLPDPSMQKLDTNVNCSQHALTDKRSGTAGPCLLGQDLRAHILVKVCR